MSKLRTTPERSRLMSTIRGKGNRTTELAFVAILKHYNIKGWRRHYRIMGRPDFAFPKHRVAVFIDGCFWHGCRWHSRQPARNEEFWRSKIEANRARDRRVSKQLRAAGWTVLRIWEHSLCKPQRVYERLRTILEAKDYFRE